MKRILKRIPLAALGITALALAAACTHPGNANNIEHAQANAGLDLILSNQPVPIFPSSALRQNLIEVEAIQALGTPTTSFFFPEGTTIVSGKFTAPPFKSCASQGEPIHATDNLTNPQQVTSGGEVVGQADPNGIYSGPSAGTYVLCDTPYGTAKMAYWEGPVFAESGAAVWNAATGQLDDVGPSQLPVCVKETSNGSDGSGLAAGIAYFHCIRAK